MKFNVIREHGDYKPGDTREANENDVRHLIGKCLVPVSEKAAEKPKNKAAKPLKNKAAD